MYSYLKPWQTCSLQSEKGLIRVWQPESETGLILQHSALQVELSEYIIQGVTEGPEALASTRCSVRPHGRMANEGFVISAQARSTLTTPCCKHLKFLTLNF